MEIFFYENDRPAALPAAVAVLPAVPAVGFPVARAHQIQDQAELALAVASIETKGISGLTSTDVLAAMKRQDVRGVPPRGKPV